MLRITRQTDYAIVLLARFAAAPADAVKNAPDLAAEGHLPAPMVSKILKHLARAGLLNSRRGAAGGYSLARSPREISVAEIVVALEGPIAMTECLTGEPGGCAIEHSCPSRPNWTRINRAVEAALAEVRLADILPQPPVARLSTAGADR
jgi:FeS assembly SUF system regulator